MNAHPHEAMGAACSSASSSNGWMTRTASRFPRGCATSSRTASSAPGARRLRRSTPAAGSARERAEATARRFTREGRAACSATSSAARRRASSTARAGSRSRRRSSGHAQLGKDIVIAGLRDRLEIWDREAWRRQLAEVEGSAEIVAERLASKRPEPHVPVLAARCASSSTCTRANCRRLHLRRRRPRALLAEDLAASGQLVAIDRDPTRAYVDALRPTAAAGRRAAALRGSFAPCLRQPRRRGRAPTRS